MNSISLEREFFYDGLTGLEHDGRKYAPHAGCVYQIVSHKIDRWASMLYFARDAEGICPQRGVVANAFANKSRLISSLVYVI